MSPSCVHRLDSENETTLVVIIYQFVYIESLVYFTKLSRFSGYLHYYSTVKIQSCVGEYSGLK